MDAIPSALCVFHKFLGGFLEFMQATSYHGDECALLDGGFGNGEPNATGCTGDEDMLPLQRRQVLRGKAAT